MWNVLSHYEVASSLRTNRCGLYLPAPPHTQAAHNHICEDSFLLRCCVLNTGPWICEAHSTAELYSQTKRNNFTTNPSYTDIYHSSLNRHWKGSLYKLLTLTTQRLVIWGPPTARMATGALSPNLGRCLFWTQWRWLPLLSAFWGLLWGLINAYEEL